MLLFGQLTYSVLTAERVRALQDRKTPVIHKEMLNPVLAEPSDGASPVGRDPFEVEWSSYLPKPKPEPSPAPRPTSRPTSRPTAAPTTRPEGPALPPMPSRLTAVITGVGHQMAIIDEHVYKPGSLIGGTDAERCWCVEAIERERVTLRCGQARRLLKLHRKAPPGELPEDGW